MSTKTNANAVTNKSNKNKKVGTKSTNPSKSAKADKKEGELTQANVAKAALQVLPGRESKYAYPENVKTPADKKVFRRNARQQRNKFMVALEKLRASNEKADKAELKKIEEEQKEWMKKTYTALPQ